jgi:hypothetical protein
VASDVAIERHTLHHPPPSSAATTTLARRRPLPLTLHEVTRPRRLLPFAHCDSATRRRRRPDPTAQFRPRRQCRLPRSALAHLPRRSTRRAGINEPRWSFIATLLCTSALPVVSSRASDDGARLRSDLLRALVGAVAGVRRRNTIVC